MRYQHNLVEARSDILGPPLVYRGVPFQKEHQRSADRSRARRSHRVHRTAHRAPYHYDWHDTSHWDYHPPSYVRHYDHYDYVPGHWDFHRTGHWDRHRGYRHW